MTILREVRPVPDIAASLEGRSASDLLLLCVAIEQRWAMTEKKDVGFHLNRYGDTWSAVLTRAEGERFDTYEYGEGEDPATALRELLRKVTSEDEDDDRPELVAEFADGEVASA